MRPISWVLAPTWAMNAVRESALGGNPWPDLALATALGCAYLGARAARPRADAGRGPRAGGARTYVRSLRLFFVGGLTSYRALFHFLTPAIFIPSLLVAPVFQVLLFAYIGRAAGVASDEFFLVGNALQYASIPCIFAMTQVVSEERFWQTLGPILVSPAPRLPLFVGRALPVVVNAFGGLGVHVRRRRRCSSTSTSRGTRSAASRS